MRCGQCDEVFDANAHLQTLSTADATVAPAAEVPPSQVPSYTAPPPIEKPPEPVEVAYDWGDISVDSAAPAPATDAEDPPPHAGHPAQEPMADEPLATHPNAESGHHLPAEDSFLSHNPHDLSVAEEALADQYAAAPPQALVPAEEAAREDEAPLSFMPRATKQSPWARWFGTPFWVVAITVFTALLALQVAVHARDRLAAAYPASQPALDALCDALGCTVAAPRHIESIAIDSSSFNSLKPGVFLLKVTLKNADSWRLEMPALELTLTDRQDQVVLRRVLRAADYAGDALVIDAGSERSVHMPVQVQSGVAVEQIAGYKLLAFYP